jgi:hypothetical protein
VHSVKWILQQSVEDPAFTAEVLFTEESCFIISEFINIGNGRMWSDESPHAIRSHQQQRPFSISPWAGISGDCLIGPHILPARVGGRDYLDFLPARLS